MSEAAGRIIRATAAHAMPWAQMRTALWPDSSMAEHLQDITDMLEGGDSHPAFIMLDEGGDAVAFVEAALRHDYVNGCDTSPVVFVEGLYVTERARRGGVAKLLIDRVAAWGQAQGCVEMASDTAVTNLESHAFHLAAGFIETERVVYFRKAIG
jgi:aminoglycoside 6'-N-acetyltransferase I